MKTDREFIEGIYLKAKEYEDLQDKKVSLFNNKRFAYQVSVVMTILVLTLALYSYKNIMIRDKNKQDDFDKINIVRHMVEFNIIEGQITKINKDKQYFFVKIKDITAISDNYKKEVNKKRKIKIYYDSNFIYFQNKIEDKVKANFYIDKDEKGRWLLIDIEPSR